MKTGLHGGKKFSTSNIFLAVIVIILLLEMLIPTTPHIGNVARIAKAKVEIADIVNAINSYQTEYGHYPVPDLPTNTDATYGPSMLLPIENFKHGYGEPRETRLIESNSDIITILLDFDLGVNAGHKLNPRQIKFLNAKIVEDLKSGGVSSIDHQYRDPWGNPYVITLDLNKDGQCSDELYRRQAVSQTTDKSSSGWYGLVNSTDKNGAGDHFCYPGKMMVWSLGKDGKMDAQAPANTGVNKDNILSWQ